LFRTIKPNEVEDKRVGEEVELEDSLVDSKDEEEETTRRARRRNNLSRSRGSNLNKTPMTSKKRLILSLPIFVVGGSLSSTWKRHL